MTQNAMKKPFDPFHNDHQSMQVGELIIENQMDKVIIYGDIDIKKSQEGLEQALKLQTVVNNIVANLNQANLEGNLSTSESVESASVERIETQSSKKVDNPFS